MIQITKVESVNDIGFDHIKCPICKTRLCNKAKGEKVNLIQFPKSFTGNAKMSQILLQCHKCKSKYLFSIAE